ncbi:sensor histidine kinase [Promicromonospora sp. NPDC090134]|uniref:sensor histidine kinase n=1 Tax=Promicromonospora sp. NPDC090134 TaxID=3364408 RepID=UPI003819B675
MGWYERWQGWTERHRFLVDLTWTVLLGLLALVTSTDMYSSGPTTQAIIISAAVLAPMPWCRTRPVISCALVFVACMVHMTFLGVPVVLPADLVVLVSLYCVTVYGPRWSYLAAGGAAVVGVLTLGISGWINFGSSLAHGIPTMIGAGSLLATAFALGLVRRSRRLMMEALRDRAERLEIERDQQAQIATAAERARIAREMHDIVAHSLSVVIAQADGGRYAAAADPAAAQRSLGTIAETGRAALADMRRLLGVLREGPDDGGIPLGLVAPDGASSSRLRPPSGAGVTTLGPGADRAGDAGAVVAVPDGGAPLRPQPDVTDLRDLVDQARADGLRVSWARVGVERRLPPGVGLTLFRVCQEALTNVRKHAGPRPAVTLLLRWGEDEVELRVDDDGRGLAAAGSTDAAEPQPAAGFGLLGMRERAEMFGGTLTAGPRGGGGFSVRFVVPIPRAEAPEPATPAEPAEPGPPTTEPSTTPKENDD